MIKYCPCYAYHSWIHVLFEVGATQTSIPVVCDVAAVHDFAEEVPQVLPRHLRIGFQVVEEHVDADGEVADVERVAAVPALRPELASLADDCVEVAEGEEDALELRLTCAHLQRVLDRPATSSINIFVFTCQKLQATFDNDAEDFVR